MVKKIIKSVFKFPKVYAPYLTHLKGAEKKKRVTELENLAIGSQKDKAQILKQMQQIEQAKPVIKVTKLVKITKAEKQRKVDHNFKLFDKKLKRLYTGEINRIDDQSIRNLGGDNNIPKILNEILKMAHGKQYVLQSGHQHVTLTRDNIKIMKDALQGVVVEEFTDSLNNVITEVQKNHSFSLYKPQQFERAKLGGAFFKYTHNLDFDLSELGIYKEVNASNYKNNCFYDALYHSGLEYNKLMKLRLMIVNETIPISKIKDICKLLEIKITLHHIKDNKRTQIFGAEYKDKHEICLYDQHYFINKPMNITSYAISNYDKLNDQKDWNLISSIQNGKYKRDSSRLINSLQVIQQLTNPKNKDKLLNPIKLNEQLYGTTLYHCVDDSSFETLTFSESSCRLDDGIIEDQDISKDYVEANMLFNVHKFEKAFFDFETNTKNETHEPYLCCYKKLNDDKIYEFEGKQCGRKMLESLKDNTFLIAHNAKYDFTFLLKHLMIISYVPKNNTLMEVKAIFYNHRTKKSIKIIIHDSLKFIPKALKEFNNMFGLAIDKEVMPYEVYTTENIEKGWIKISEALKHIKPEDQEAFQKNIDKWDCQLDDEYDILKYSLQYCRIDCEVLSKGYELFRKMIHEVTGLNIDNYISIASIAHTYMKKVGCYDDVYEISGVVRAYIQKSVIGGRTMTRMNKKYKLNKILGDLDAVSLYPSAIKALGGFLKGLPKILKDLSYDFLKKQDGYFVKILVKKVNKHRKFPLLSSKNDQGIRYFSNDMVNKQVYIDKISLEDVIEFQQIEFDIIDGYYFNEGRNIQSCEIIQYLFNERLKKKKEGNKIEEVIKLLLNSCYGRSILKPIDEDVCIITGKDKFDKYLSRNYAYVKTGFEINNQQYLVKTSKTINEHFNYAHVGAEILAMSKRIMNRVMCLAEDLGIEIYYQDTDSMHIEYDQIDKLAKSYKDKYHTELIGDNMGQFHVDFKLENKKTKQKALTSTIKATNSIFLGKKAYLDVLEGLDKDGNKITGFHARMKGISKDALEYYCEQNKCTLLDLYKRLYDGVKIKFDLLCGGKKFVVKNNSDLSMSSCKEFIREVKF